MNRLAEGLARVAADLDDLRVSWAVVGGLAVSVWGEPRLTRDIDVAVIANTDQDAERVVRELRDRGYGPLELVEHERAGRLATARLSVEEPDGIVIDLLFASCGIEPEIVAESILIEVFPSLQVRVAVRPSAPHRHQAARSGRSYPSAGLRRRGLPGLWCGDATR